MSSFKKINENERLAQHIYSSQMQKLQGKIIEKKLTKSSKLQESQSQNISNNNSPVIGRQKSYENLQKVNRTFVNPNIQVQKLSSILNVMAGQQLKKNYASFNNELMETVKVSKMRKNQSMIQIEQQSPPLTKNTSFHRPNSSVKNKLNSNSVSTEYSQIQKIKEKIKILLQERDKSLQQDQKEVQFMTKFNQALNQLLVVIFQDHQIQQPSSTQDSFQTLQIDHFFKRQIQILQQSYQQQQEKKKIEAVLQQLKKKHESIVSENVQLVAKSQQQEETIHQLRSQIDTGQLETETQELKFLVQGQFEAIQKLLQREQLMKVFLKRVGDSSIIEMFEQFILNAEFTSQDDTEGNLNINMLPNKAKQTPKSAHSGKLPDQILQKYEQSYKQLNLQDSLYADDSRVNDSEESSFGYIGKEQATEVSCYFGQGTTYKGNPRQVKMHKDMKEKLKINMMDVQLMQAAQITLIFIFFYIKDKNMR